MVKYYGSNSVRQVRRISNARRKQNIKIIQAFVAAVMAFAMCQLPTHVIWLWHDFGTGSKWNYLYDILPFCHILTYLNSAIDPFIFGSLNAQIFRKKFRMMFSCYKGKKRHRKNGGSQKAILPQEKENARKNSRVIRRKCLLLRCKGSRNSTMESIV